MPRDDRPSMSDFNAQLRSQLDFVLGFAPEDSRDRMLALAGELRLFQDPACDGAGPAPAQIPAPAPQAPGPVPRPPSSLIRRIPTNELAALRSANQMDADLGGWRLTTLSRSQIVHSAMDGRICVELVEAALADGSPEAVGVPCSRPEDVHPDGTPRPTTLRNCFVEHGGRDLVVLVNPESRVIVSVVPRNAEKADYTVRRVTTVYAARGSGAPATRAELVSALRRHGFDVSYGSNGQAIVSHPAMEKHHSIPAGELTMDEVASHAAALQDESGIRLRDDRRRG